MYFNDATDYAKEKGLPNWNKGFSAFMYNPSFRLHYTNDGYFYMIKVSKDSRSKYIKQLKSNGFSTAHGESSTKETITIDFSDNYRKAIDRWREIETLLDCKRDLYD